MSETTNTIGSRDWAEMSKSLTITWLPEQRTILGLFVGTTPNQNATEAPSTALFGTHIREAARVLIRRTKRDR